MTWLKLVPSWAWLAGAWALSLVLVGGAQQVRVSLAQVDAAQAVAAKEQQTAVHEQTLSEIARAAARQLQAQQEQRQALELRLAALDAKEHKELTDAQAENDRLQRLYAGADAERKRLRIDVIVASNDRVVSDTASAGSVGNGASVELSERAGSAFWNIRGGMISDRAKLAYLQGYVCEQRPDLAACK
ncbi:lysis system i-spanin subunit Rz [Pseudomonas sp. EA_35y_Pfl2_R111]|uniref:lysis system i-spanin subunit Rz n=1 Tax=Pseudomonas sp. EA_35y_Pfl2_R111 TaxID=3088689 RepID=UPI0030DB4D22